MIIPTIGRVVWFWPESLSPVSQPEAALVAWVHSNTMVNLAVFDSNGNAYSRTSVPLFQGDGERPDHTKCHFCEWMPYQIGKAKEELHPVRQFGEATMGDVMRPDLGAMKKP